MAPIHAFAALKPSAPLVDFDYEPLSLEQFPNYVHVKITHCGCCYSDVHRIHDAWPDKTYFPLVPGHEIVGIVEEIGSKVTTVKKGDRVGVGVIIDSCGSCDFCKRGEEQYCHKVVYTYNTIRADTKENTYGGYAYAIRVKETFAIKIPDALKSEEAAPLLCAGITTYDPLVHWGVKAGKKVGIIGIGGLGHLAVQFAAKLGADVYAISTSSDKEEFAKSLGAKNFINSRDPESMKKGFHQMDFLLCTISADFDVKEYLDLLANDGVLCFVSLPPNPWTISPFYLIPRRLSIAGSLIGGLKATREMLQFAADHGIHAIVETVPMDAEHINKSIEKMESNKVRYRMVLENKSA